MDKPGVYNIGVGLVIGAIGIGVTGATYAVAPGGFFVVAYGAIGVGAIQFIIGVIQFLVFQLRSPDGKAIHYAKIELRAFVRSMIAMAAANKTIDAAEVGMISAIYQNFLGGELDAQTIRQTADQMINDSDYSIYEELKSTQAQIGDPMKELIVKACYLVVVADGSVDDAEKQRIGELASVLNISAQRFGRLVSEVQGSLAPAPKADAQAAAAG